MEDTLNLFALREQFSKAGIMMCFNVPFSHSIIEEIGTAIRNHLCAENLPPMAVQDVFAVYIEMTQNARNYLHRQETPSNDAGAATIIIARQEESYVISSGNVIRKEDVAGLSHRIDQINSLDRENLKKAIRQQLRREAQGAEQGAGIGLMEMAKRSATRLEFTFQEIDNQSDFFTLTVKI